MGLWVAEGCRNIVGGHECGHACVFVHECVFVRWDRGSLSEIICVPTPLTIV